MEQHIEKKEHRSPMVMTVMETSRALRIARAKVYIMIEDGLLEAYKVGADWRVRRTSVEKYTGTIPDSFFNKSRNQTEEEEVDRLAA